MKMAMKMTEDKRLSELDFIPGVILGKLNALEIRTVRQLFARLRNEEIELRDYLELSDQEFALFRKNVEDFIEAEFPEDTLPHIHPPVHKGGVAVNRLDDPSRPKYYDQDDE
jgi:hypothetical protein